MSELRTDTDTAARADAAPNAAPEPDDVTRRQPSVDLALNLFCATADDRWAARGSFCADAPLVRHNLV